MEIDKKLHDEIREYCRYNNIKIGEYINSLLRKAFNEDRYGTMPFPLMKDEEKVLKPEKDLYISEVPEIVEVKAEEKVPVPEPEIENKPEIKEIKTKKVIRKLK